MGVTGGTPIGFDVGAKEAGGTLRGLDLVIAFPIYQFKDLSSFLYLLQCFNDFDNAVRLAVSQV